MQSFINKILDLFTIKPRKLTQFLIILFTFTLLFQNQAISLYELITDKLHILFADSFIDTLNNIHLSNDEVLTIWSFLLYLFIITVILDSINQLLHNDTPITLGSGADFLFEANSIFLLLIMIYNRINVPGITLPFNKPDNVYFVLFIYFLFMFVFIFLATYFYNPLVYFQKICNAKLKLRITLSLVLLEFSIYFSFIILIYIILKN